MNYKIFIDTNKKAHDAMLNILITFGLLHHAPYTFVNPESTVNNPLGKRSFFFC